MYGKCKGRVLSRIMVGHKARHLRRDHDRHAPGVVSLARRRLDHCSYRLRGMSPTLPSRVRVVERSGYEQNQDIRYENDSSTNLKLPGTRAGHSGDDAHAESHRKFPVDRHEKARTGGRITVQVVRAKK